MARNTKPRLGRGLSSLMNESVPVEAQPEPDSKSSSAPPPSSVPSAEMEAKPTTVAREQAQGDAIVRIPLDSILPNKYQPRSTIDEADLEGLASSIRETGLMQPIAVRATAGKSGGGAGSGAQEQMYELIAGERRWRAARLAELDRIPAIVHEVDDRHAAEWAIIENVQRENLNPIDRGQAYANLARRFGLTHAEIAERVGVDRSTIANLIRIVGLEPEIRDMVSSGRLSTGHAKALLSMPSGPERVKIATVAADRGQTVRALEAVCASQGKDGAVRLGHPQDNEQELQIKAAIEDLAKGIGEHLGTRVRIRTGNGEKGTLEIDFYDLDHFDGLMNRIGYVSGAS